MTRGSQQHPWVLAEVVSTHRCRHGGTLWFRAISGASILGSFFLSSFFTPISTSVAFSLWNLNLHFRSPRSPPSVFIWHAHFFKLKRFPASHPRRVQKWAEAKLSGCLRTELQSVPRPPLNDKIFETNQKRVLLRDNKTILIISIDGTISSQHSE